MKSGSTHCSEDVEDRERTIAELEDRIRVLENELLLEQKDNNFKEVAEHGQAMEALRVSEERLRRASRAGHIGLYEWNKDRDLVYYSPEAIELFGLDPNYPITFDKWLARVHPGDREMVKRKIAEANENGRSNPNFSAQLEYRVVHDDGAALWLEALSTYVLECGELIVWGAVRDITERKRAEEALRESERRLRRTSSAGQIGLYEWNEDHDTVYLSPEAYELFGCEPGSTITFEKFFERVHPDDRERFRRSNAEARKKAHTRSSGIAQGEFRVVHEDGFVHWLEATATYDLEGEGIMVRGAVRDITEQKRAEEELANAKAQAELYLDLMGHDINNFNQAARGYLELMDGMVEDGELKRLISKPLEAIDGSSLLIQNVQKLQQAQSGEHRLEALDLGALVEEVARQFKYIPGDKPVNIACDTVKGVRVRANELLRDVFLNLVGNAIKHSPGPAEINIHMALEENDGRGYYRVFIDDNGPGVPDDMKEKIFDRLSRGNTKAKGSGLGLYLVRTLVDSYGGRVWVEDRIHGDHMKGARFVVMLPAVENQ